VGFKIEHALPPGSMLHHYRVEQTLGGGGFSIVYRAVDTNANKRVVIKEYLPTSQATRLPDESVETISAENVSTFRQGMKRFFDEAAALARVSHPNIVRVSDFFRENNTVYLVMDFEEGKDLRWYIKQYKGHLSEKFIRTVFPQVLDGLKVLHAQQLLHLDIKPGNILIRPGGRPMLLDFGATQAAYADNRPLGPHTLTLGFAPLEQHRRGHVGPWTDVYALGATIYACMNGKAPPPSPRRAEKDSYKPATRVFARRYSRPLCEMVDWCLHMDQVRRPQSVEELIDLFNQPFTAGAEEEPATTLLDRLGLKLPWPRR
jgi:serine/threonine protein kinase